MAKIVKLTTGPGSTYLYRGVKLVCDPDAKGRYCHWAAYVPSRGLWVRTTGRTRKLLIKSVDFILGV